MAKQNRAADEFLLDEKKGYFSCGGVDVMAFDDIYPAGHQSGVSIIMHGNRVATNGDIRLEQTPGQWQPVPKQLKRTVDAEENEIITSLQYPDNEGHLKGFNPIIYPDLELKYQVRVTGMKDGVKVRVDLEQAVPERFLGKVCFNIELFPGCLFGRPWIMDGKQGIFPRQANGPLLKQKSNLDHVGHFDGIEESARAEDLIGDRAAYNPIAADDLIAEPYAVGKKITVRPDDPYSCFSIESRSGSIKLYDGRMNHNNGWFVVSGEVPAGMTEGAVEWIIRPHVVKDWMYQPVVQVSQVGYHPAQPKQAVIELDARDTGVEPVSLIRITEDGAEIVCEREPEVWGSFLRYRYLIFDFSDIKEEGLYKVCYGKKGCEDADPDAGGAKSGSVVFRIAADIYDRGVWQPVLEYFLPVQMCHMRVQEKYRVWHGHCHSDDARMAPLDRWHFDGYVQGKSTMTNYHPGDVVPGLDKGGWHDAGDHDLRVESQSGESYILAMAYEAFGVEYDATTIDQQNHLVEIHQPDGKNDILQQIEHGMLTVLGGYHALGRLYRGIIANNLRRYVLLGDMSNMTAGIKGDEDDRWVFTEDNPVREFLIAAHMAGSARALRGYNDTLSGMAVEAAKELFAVTRTDHCEIEEKSLYENNTHRNAVMESKIHAAVELFITTGEDLYRSFLLEQTDFIIENLESLGWLAAKADRLIRDEVFRKRVREGLIAVRDRMASMCGETPYGIPYKPYIWGAGWQIQGLAFQYYYLHSAYPDLFAPDMLYHALDFVLGCHPGSNTSSFASGVGARSATTAYGMNRADWSYIPGGVISGTALIRPDFPELLEFPFLWQQGEYVLGGGSSNYLFLVLAVKQLLDKETRRT